MKINDNAVVAIQYTLTDDQGNVIDQSPAGEPLKYLHGAHNIIPGLENALIDASVGDKKQVTVSAEDGYGPVNDELIQTVPREAFTGIDKIEVGMQFQVQGQGDEEHFVEVKSFTDSEVTVDGNHPLAGQTLNFDIEIVEVREATESEIAHGHVH